MKKRVTKTALIAGSLVIATGYTNYASAHSITGSLGAVVTARDVYKLTCPAGTHHLYFRVQDIAPVASPTIGITVAKGGARLSSGDPGDNDGVPSVARRLAQGFGVYTITVRKTNRDLSLRAFVENYTAEFHCENAANAHMPQGEPRVSINQ